MKANGNIWGTADGGDIRARQPARPPRAVARRARSALARRSGSLFGGIAISLLALFALLALVSYRPSDPSLNTAAGGPVGNWMGSPGAWTADMLLSVMGPPVGAAAAAVAGDRAQARARQPSPGAGCAR